MRERFREPLSLDVLAREAFLSAYHFNRVFRGATGVPPGRFLAALRMDAAKQMLLSTPHRVTDICLEVGYRSLGTFTTHFRQLVGLSPMRMRQLADAHGDVMIASLATPCRHGSPEPGTHALHVRSADDFQGTAFVGLFQTPLPQSCPAGCAVVQLPAETGLACAAPGTFFALAAAYALGLTVRDALLADANETRVAATSAPLLIGERLRAVTIDLELRRLDTLDPPILLALPLVLADSAEASGSVRRKVA
jgi:AraC-like DNA-binding protein